jgi:hypothetical protein
MLSGLPCGSPAAVGTVASPSDMTAATADDKIAAGIDLSEKK